MTVLLLAANSLAGDRLENDFKAVFVKHWQISKEFTLAVAEAMPAESYNFKPNPQEMSFGEMMFWLAKSNSGACARVAGTEEMAEPASMESKLPSSFLPIRSISAPKTSLLRPLIRSRKCLTSLGGFSPISHTTGDKQKCIFE